MINIADIAQQVGSGGFTAGFLAIAYGVIRVIDHMLDQRKANGGKSIQPANVDHGPCNKAVDALTAAMHEEVEEQRAFRVTFEKYLAREEGRREGEREVLAKTGDMPSPR